MSLFTNDIETVQECLGWGTMMFVDALFLGALAIVKMATLNPAKLMGLDKKGRIEVGCDADFIIVDNDFNLIKSIARGEF